MSGLKLIPSKGEKRVMNFKKEGRFEFWVKFNNQKQEDQFIETCGDMSKFDKSMILTVKDGWVGVSSIAKTQDPKSTHSPWDLLLHQAWHYSNVKEAELSDVLPAKMHLA